MRRPKRCAGPLPYSKSRALSAHASIRAQRQTVRGLSSEMGTVVAYGSRMNWFAAASSATASWTASRASVVARVCSGSQAAALQPRPAWAPSWASASEPSSIG